MDFSFIHNHIHFESLRTTLIILDETRPQSLSLGTSLNVSIMPNTCVVTFLLAIPS